jgi:putative addiction module component (TIGR02574 family)
VIRAAKRAILSKMSAASKLLEEAMQLSEDDREELAVSLLDSLETPPGISIDETAEIERRANDARSGKPGIPWDEVKRNLPR